MREGEFGKEYILVFKEEADSSADIVVTDADIENIKRAKAAIYSATASLVRHMRLEFNQIKKFKTHMPH